MNRSTEADFTEILVDSQGASVGKVAIGTSLIIPTYNERENVIPLLSQIIDVSAHIPMGMEIIVVDDNSPDGTAYLVVDWLANTFGKIGIRDSEHVCLLPQGERKEGRWVRVVRRPRKMGLASAVVEGMRRARGGILGFMDADLSHPPSVIPSLVGAVVESDGADLVIGSRYVPGSRTVGVPWWRKQGSRLANWLARPVSPVRDSTSGFMFFRRDIIKAADINTNRFHVGLEIIAKGRYHRCLEVPYRFSARSAGESKFRIAAFCNLAIQLACLPFAVRRTKTRRRRSVPKPGWPPPLGGEHYES